MKKKNKKNKKLNWRSKSPSIIISSKAQIILKKIQKKIFVSFTTFIINEIYAKTKFKKKIFLVLQILYEVNFVA